MTSFEFDNLCKPTPIKRITFATIYQIYEDSDDSISDSEDLISNDDSISDDDFVTHSKHSEFYKKSKEHICCYNREALKQNKKSTNSKVSHKCTEIYVPKAIPVFNKHMIKSKSLNKCNNLITIGR